MVAVIIFLLLLALLLYELRKMLKKWKKEEEIAEEFQDNVPGQSSKDSIDALTSIKHGKTTKEKGEGSMRPGNFKNLSIKEIEERLEKEDNHIYTDLPDLIRQQREQERKNNKIKELIKKGSPIKEGIFRNLTDLGNLEECILIVEIEENSAPNNKFYKSLRAQTLKQCEVVIKEFEKTSEKLEKKYLTQQNLEKIKEEEKLNKELSDLSDSEDFESIEWSKIEEKHLNIEEGFLYALSNPSMPGLLKIGFTKNSPNVRALDLSRSTSVPTPFKLEKFWKVKSPFLLEQMLHKEFEERRSGKEFFKVDVETLSSIVETVYKEYL